MNRILDLEFTENKLPLTRLTHYSVTDRKISALNHRFGSPRLSTKIEEYFRFALALNALERDIFFDENETTLSAFFRTRLIFEAPAKLLQTDSLVLSKR